MPDRVRAHLHLSGLVQGVWFRQSTANEAARLGVDGLARNLDDGRVEVIAEGERAKVEALVAWCRHGPPRARVDEVELAWERPAGEGPGFRVER